MVAAFRLVAHLLLVLELGVELVELADGLVLNHV